MRNEITHAEQLSFCPLVKTRRRSLPLLPKLNGRTLAMFCAFSGGLLAAALAAI